MEQYTTPVPLPQYQTRFGGPEDVLNMLVTAGDPSRAELLASIPGSRVALEGKIEMVAEEVNPLQVDLKKVSEKVTVAEGSIVELQTEVGALGKQMVQRASLTVHRASVLRVRTGELAGRDTEQVVDIDTSNRVVIQHDGTMAMVPPGLDDGSVGTLDQGAKKLPVDI
ncbi:hypothetical protein NDU88_001190 [Pleurodeles waltl]|uniref:Uncharacterized protein n=1 Tax=Pleurodeles waltl TaxID=8319 RepID=A0AAV7NCS0_PLEWA|nr:hypothetical protein NDU88_001190 [Pleurodeles waltl]